MLNRLVLADGPFEHDALLCVIGGAADCVAADCFVVAGVSRELRDADERALAIPLQDVFRGIGPFFVADVLTVAVLLAWPGVVLWLPRRMG